MSINSAAKFLVSPKPVIVRDELAHIGAGLRFSHNPTAFFAELREEYGDTFLVDIFGYKLFCVFSPQGLKSLYAAQEEDASFGMATFDMLGFKTPIEVFMDAHIDLFYELLKPDRVAAYLKDFSSVIDEVLSEWGEGGSIAVFDAVRTLEQRIGLRIWVGEEAAKEGVWQQFKEQLDALSQENAFVSPQDTLETIRTDKAREKQAIAEISRMLATILDQRKAQDAWPEDTLSYLYSLFANDDHAVTLRKVTHNVINANQGFLSNLYAALAWMLLNVCRLPHVREQLSAEITATKAAYGERFYESQKALDSMRIFEQTFMESIRLAQRSLTLRKVMRETVFDCGEVSYTLQPGVYVATMLSVTNTQTAGLAKFDIDHYAGRRIAPHLIAAGKECVSTFGHGVHACPAQKFSHNMCKVLFSMLLQRFQFLDIDGEIAPSSTQMGGVARIDGDVRLGFKAMPVAPPG